MTVWVGRYAVVSGQVREHGPWLVDRVRRREDEELRVVVLAEPVDQRSAEFCTEVAEAVAALFARESLSLTGGLLRALRQAHANLAEWNRRSLREHHVAVGVTCVVVRDNDEVLVAQAGPGVAYTRQGNTVRRLSTDGLPASIPLGDVEPIEPLFTSFSLADGQLLLLTENAERATGLLTIEAALRAGPERALAEIFPHTRGLTDMTAVLIADLDIDEQQAAAPLDFGEDPAEVEGRAVAFSGGDPPVPPRVRRPRNWRVLGGDRSPPMPELRRTRAVGARDSVPTLVPWRTAGIVATVAIMLTLAAWLVLPGLLSDDRAAELSAAIASAEAQLEIASSVGTPEQQRTALQNALIQAERARALAPDDPRIPRIVADADARLQSLDAIAPVEALEGILTFDGAVTAPVEPQELVAGGGFLWLREAGQGRVIRVDPVGNAEPFEVYRAGESYGEMQARDPAAIAWDASTSRLLVLDTARTLFAVSLDGTTERLSLRDATELRSVAAIAVYLGNLYLLDPAGGQVWRYLPAGDGFDSERSGILGAVELGTATALAVDGQVFVLDPPGLRRFVQGREQEPLFQGIDQPPTAAVGLVEDVLRQILYVADRGGGRVIASERDGMFLRQYRHPDFIDLRGLTVAPDGTAIYALTGSGISRFAITPR